MVAKHGVHVFIADAGIYLVGCRFWLPTSDARVLGCNLDKNMMDILVGSSGAGGWRLGARYEVY